jgi:hypothetical protein
MDACAAIRVFHLIQAEESMTKKMCLLLPRRRTAGARISRLLACFIIYQLNQVVGQNPSVSCPTLILVRLRTAWRTSPHLPTYLSIYLSSSGSGKAP